MERFDPACGHHAWYEHWHRYHWVRALACDKTVVDIACGEGYGSDLLIREAKLVLGVDLDQATLSDARARYARDDLQFILGSADCIPVKEGGIDLVVSFETLEHLHAQETMVAEIARVLNDDGLAIISTPDRDVYSPDGVTHNEYHVKELNAEEFEELLSARFPFVRFFGQEFQLFSTIHELGSRQDGAASILYGDASKGSETAVERSGRPMYRIALCGFSEAVVATAQLAASHAFSDMQGSLWHHYEEQIARLQEVDLALERARQELRESRSAAAHLAARLGF